MKKEFQDLK
jgi:hypothetical protein